MKKAKIKNAVPLSTGECYVEFTDSTKQLARARKALDLKENEALLVFTDGEREFAGDWCALRAYLIEMDSPFGGSSLIEIDSGRVPSNWKSSD
jgi:hypothetical protein